MPMEHQMEKEVKNKEMDLSELTRSEQKPTKIDVGVDGDKALLKSIDSCIALTMQL